VNPAEHAALWQPAALLFEAAVAFIAAAYAVRPRNKPPRSYLLFALAVYVPVCAADFAPLACALRGANPDSADAFTFVAYAAAIVIAVAALRHGETRAVLCAVVAVLIRWALGLSVALLANS